MVLVLAKLTSKGKPALEKGAIFCGRPGGGYLPLSDFAKSQVNWEKHTQTIDKISVCTYVQSGTFRTSFIFAVWQRICHMAGELRCLRL
jgi:hypothetical protein